MGFLFFFVQTSVSLQQQQLLFNGKEIRNAERLRSVGVGDGDLVMMMRVSQSQPPRYCGFLLLYLVGGVQLRIKAAVFGSLFSVGESN